jgi:hypothetical protein
MLLRYQRVDFFVKNRSYKTYPHKGRPRALKYWDLWSIDKGFLRFKKKTYMPNQKALCNEIICVYYNDKTAGYLSVRKTLELIRRKYS